ncbi:hypothetical protein H9Q08_05635 [Chryseobacterium sp. PS-8]|uniref:Uncharacterized protein n=1 Tax=Chryseobacterium indicum TaxID=2766954 RepID=A0ABS9C2L4_9FLAO|nr:hypothetical protein [Chryseobacterium sp. PS-8]MCF2218779.1 hypothetical protein [Chryseobacterium sp. PS-8]
MEKDYQNLIGKSKKEILAELGDEFNFYPSTIWSYHLRKKWYFRKNILFLFFEDNILVKVLIKAKWF